MTQVRCGVLKRIQEFLNTQNVASTLSIKRHKNKKNWNDCECLTITGGLTSFKLFLEGMMPYLIVKKTLAQDCLRYMRMYPNRRYGLPRIYRHGVYKRNVVLC